MKQLAFNHVNFNHLQEENEKLHDLISELTARLTIQQYDEIHTGTKGASRANPRSKGGANKASGRKGEPKEVQ